MRFLIIFGLLTHVSFLLPWLAAIAFSAFISEKDPDTMFCCRAILFLIALPQSILLFLLFSKEPLTAASVLMVQWVVLYFIIDVLCAGKRKLFSFAEKRHFRSLLLLRMLLILLYTLILLLLYVVGLVSLFQIREGSEQPRMTKEASTPCSAPSPREARDAHPRSEIANKELTSTTRT